MLTAAGIVAGVRFVAARQRNAFPSAGATAAARRAFTNGNAVAVESGSITSSSRRFNSSSMAPSAATGNERIDSGGDLVGYVTDVEGCGDYFEHYVAISRVLRRDPVTKRLELRDPTKHQFVFGGDLFDRGPNDLRLAADLVQLKRKYPDRVHLIVGNRDMNKAKLYAELHPEYIQATLGGTDDVAVPFFCPQKDALSYREFLEQKVIRRVDAKHNNNYRRAAAEPTTAADRAAVDCAANRLKWHLSTTMGCPHTFELRRQELREMQRSGGGAAGKNSTSSMAASGAKQEGEIDALASRSSDPTVVSDADVAQSFFDQVAPGRGIVAEYLSLAQIAAVIGDTLFVHGAVNHHAFGFVPDATPGAILERRYRNETTHRALVPLQPTHAKSGPIPPADSSASALSGGWRYLDACVRENPAPDDIPGRHLFHSHRHGAATAVVADGAVASGGDRHEERPPNAHEWVDAVNAFYRSGFEQWMAQPAWRLVDRGASLTSGRRWQRGGSALLMYGHVGAMGPHTAMVLTFLSHGSLSYVDLRTVLLLNGAGINRVVVGHQPAGDTPSVIRQPGLTVVMADNSYCDSMAADSRGQAVCEVLLDVDRGTCRGHGVRVDGTPFDVDLEHVWNGVRLRDGRWTKLVVQHPQTQAVEKVLVQRILKRFFEVQYEWLDAVSLERLLPTAEERLGQGEGDVPPGVLGASASSRPPRQHTVSQRLAPPSGAAESEAVLDKAAARPYKAKSTIVATQPSSTTQVAPTPASRL